MSTSARLCHELRCGGVGKEQVFTMPRAPNEASAVDSSAAAQSDDTMQQDASIKTESGAANAPAADNGAADQPEAVVPAADCIKALQDGEMEDGELEQQATAGRKRPWPIDSEQLIMEPPSSQEDAASEEDEPAEVPKSAPLSSSSAPSSWSCSVCTYLNSAALRNCDMCNAVRKDAPASASTATAAAAAGATAAAAAAACADFDEEDSSSKSSETGWTCQQCTYVNAPCTVCAMCGYTTAAAAADSGPVAGAIPCEACTALNDPGASPLCSACGAPLPGEAPRRGPPPKTCNGCTTVNSAHADQCSSCGAALPESAPLAPVPTREELVASEQRCGGDDSARTAGLIPPLARRTTVSSSACRRSASVVVAVATVLGDDAVQAAIRIALHCAVLYADKVLPLSAPQLLSYSYSCCYSCYSGP
jgi:Zn-finger in Ran binding protein and others